MTTSWNKLNYFQKIFLYGRNYLYGSPYYFKRLIYKNLEIVKGKTKLKFVNLGIKSFYRVKTIFEKEPGTINWINNFKKDDIFWDIGANIGIYTIYAAIKSKVKVYSFEPMPLNYKNLFINISLNKLEERVMPFCLVLNDKNISSYLYIKWFEEGFAGTSFNTPLEISNTKGFKIKQFCINIDTLVYKLGLPCPNYLKIDVDGNDFLVLKGAKKVTKDPKLKSILIELPIGKVSLKEKEKVKREIKNYLKTYNFSFFKNEGNNYIFNRK